jgi:D-threo-aldose 1-dehydrogenase
MPNGVRVATGGEPARGQERGVTAVAQRRAVRDTGVALTGLSLGGAQIGNLYRPTTDEDARGAVDAAWEAGVRYFDTAPHYGLGLSERRMGDALRARPRDEFVLSTKVGRLLEPVDGATGQDDEGFAVPATYRRRRDYSRDGVLRSVESSLERLGLDRIDVLFVHDPDDHYRDVLDGAYPALHQLREDGVVGAIGAGMNQAEMLADFVRNTDMDLLMLAGRYTLLEQNALDDLLPECARRRTSIVAAGVFNSGLLARDEPPDDAKYDYADAPPGLVDRARRIAAVCRRHGTSLPAAALAFPLAHPAVASVCIGARSRPQIVRNAELFEAQPPAALWAELRAEGLVRADAPVPDAANR